MKKKIINNPKTKYTFIYEHPSWFYKNQKMGLDIRQNGEQIHVCLQAYEQEQFYPISDSDINLNGLYGGQWVDTFEYGGKTYRLSVQDLTWGGASMIPPYNSSGTPCISSGTYDGSIEPSTLTQIIENPFSMSDYI